MQFETLNEQNPSFRIRLSSNATTAKIKTYEDAIVKIKLAVLLIENIENTKQF